MNKNQFLAIEIWNRNIQRIVFHLSGNKILQSSNQYSISMCTGTGEDPANMGWVQIKQKSGIINIYE